MKKHLIFITLLIFILCQIPVLAHSGRTDASGGHYNHDTGEYHYHHGYPAHQHKDMDGDGDLDCPYDPPNSASQTARSSSTEYSKNTIFSKAYTNPIADAKNTSLDSSTTETVIPTGLIVLVFFQFFLVLILFFLFLNKKNKIEKTEKVYEKALTETRTKLIEDKKIVTSKLLSQQKFYENKLRQLEEANKKYPDQINQLRLDIQAERERLLNEQKDFIENFHSDLLRIFGKDCLSRLAAGDLNECVGDDGLPYYKDDTNYKWGAKYTFYIASKSNKVQRYHTRHCQYAYYKNPINAYIIFTNQDKYIPCAVCKPKIPDFDWFLRRKEYLDYLAKKYPGFFENKDE